MSISAISSVGVKPQSASAGKARRQFIVDDFILNNDVLFRDGKEIALQPKELAVLLLLLEAGGEVVHRDTFLERVWTGQDIGEESLTRSICSLRRIFRDGKGGNVILTVYGQGYRFSRPVSVIYDSAEAVSLCKLAVLPFRLDGLDADVEQTHDAVIAHLARFMPFGLTVFPAALTRHCHAAAEIVALVKEMAADYYLTGYPAISGGVRVLRVELTRAADHAVLHKEDVSLAGADWLLRLQQELTVFLPRCIPALQWGRGVPRQAALNVTLAYLHARREIRHFTPASLKRAASQLHECVALDPSHAPSWCALSETYLAIVLLGLSGRETALAEAGAAAEKALRLEPGNPLALALAAWARCLTGDVEDGGEALRQAAARSPRNATILYFQALYALSTGDLQGALDAANASLAIDPCSIGAIIVRAWTEFRRGDGDAAMAHAQRDMGLCGQDNALLRRLITAMQTARDGWACGSSHLDGVTDWLSASAPAFGANVVHFQTISKPARAIFLHRENADEVRAAS
jgi:DNA-binding winged helix-turn-helix (wHTH) protein/cytochrome c-type biogenesis protein CcmH/NrfG